MSWTRARSTKRCGFCGKWIAAGEPMRVLDVTGKLRCPTCAEEPVPELPPLEAREPTVKPLLRLVPIPVGANTLPLDWKRAGAGEREPGEEG